MAKTTQRTQDEENMKMALKDSKAARPSNNKTTGNKTTDSCKGTKGSK